MGPYILPLLSLTTVQTLTALTPAAPPASCCLPFLPMLVFCVLEHWVTKEASDCFPPSFVGWPCSSQVRDWSRMGGRGCVSPLSSSGRSSSSSQSNCKALKGVKQKEASSSILSGNITVIALCKMYWIWGKDLGGSPSEK